MAGMKLGAFSHGGTYERDANEKSHRCRHVFTTERKMFKGKFPARVIHTYIYNYKLKSPLLGCDVM